MRAKHRSLYEQSYSKPDTSISRCTAVLWDHYFHFRVYITLWYGIINQHTVTGCFISMIGFVPETGIIPPGDKRWCSFSQNQCWALILFLYRKACTIKRISDYLLVFVMVFVSRFWRCSLRKCGGRLQANITQGLWVRVSLRMCRFSLIF